ncbi:MAG: aryl-sulfate sulfotransferase [Cyclobacteriaceae bacterium]
MKFSFTLFCVLITFSVLGQFGVTTQPTEETFDGVTLIQPNASKIAYLIDNNGDVRHQWEGNYTPGVGIYLLENGDLLRTGYTDDEYRYAGGQGGILEIVSWDGTVEWSYIISSKTEKLHHDVVSLPNGNILATVWEVKSYEEAIAMGRKPELLDTALWPDKIVELEPIGRQEARIVWEWKVWDHLVQDFDETKPNFGVVQENPGKIDVNYGSTDPDWNHINALSYNSELDQIILSVPTFDEIWIIDHSTTTEEASSNTGGRSGKGGQILYRWGNQYAYKKGLASEKKLFYQHNPTWIKENNQWKVLLFNNGRNRPVVKYSTVEKIELPVNDVGEYIINDGIFGPEKSEIIYQAINPTDFFAPIVSGAQLLGNNNILITNGVSSNIFEINPSKETVWAYKVPVNSKGETVCLNDSTAASGILFRSYKYSYDYLGLLNLTNQGEIGENCFPSIPLHVVANNDPPRVFYGQNTLKVQAKSTISEVLIYTLNGQIISKISGINSKYSEHNLYLQPGIVLAKVVSNSGAILSTKFVVR